MASSDWYNSRVSENLRREILWTIANEISDPRLPDMVTVPSIKLSKDTRNATVFISVMGSDEEQRNAVNVLKHAAPFIQRQASKKVKIKNFPKLVFKIDNSLNDLENINNLLNRVQDDLDSTL